MDLQQLYSYTRRAIDDYDMIEEGDKIAVGISGGKDSLTLLYALKGLQRFYPKKFDLIAITVDLGFEGFDTAPLAQLCEELDVPYYAIPTDIGEIVFEHHKDDSPCSLCSKLRKGSLNEKAKELGYHKVAYAHHKDDIIETMLLSLIFEGRFHSFAPKTYLDRMDITLIRPMIYVNESQVFSFQKRMNLPIVKNPCPVDGITKREYAKNLLKQLNDEHPGCKERFFHALTTANFSDWPEKQPPRQRTKSRTDK